jgi:hypothetical protein
MRGWVGVKDVESIRIHNSCHPACVLTESVENEEVRLFEPGIEKSSGGMRLMVIDETDLQSGVAPAQIVGDVVDRMTGERRELVERQVTDLSPVLVRVIQRPVRLADVEARVPADENVVHVSKPDARSVAAVPDGAQWKRLVLFDAAQPLFADGILQLAINTKAGRGMKPAAVYANHYAHDLHILLDGRSSMPERIGFSMSSVAAIIVCI